MNPKFEANKLLEELGVVGVRAENCQFPTQSDGVLLNSRPFDPPGSPGYRHGHCYSF